jgi:hypothetical protein
MPISSIPAVYDPILEQIKPDTITIIGESNKKTESVELFQNLVLDAIRNHHCVVIGLEIASDQQAALDAVMQGKSSVNKIQLWPPVDHVAYRRMIENFAEFKLKGQCIRVIAIDSGTDNEIDRDQWMASRLEEQAGDKPILVLLGAMHTLKSVNWTVSSGKPSVAELLSIKGFKINSFPQRWIPDKCEAQKRTSLFISVDSPQALTILNESLISLINATPPKLVAGVVDGFLVWECA